MKKSDFFSDFSLYRNDDRKDSASFFKQYFDVLPQQ